MTEIGELEHNDLVGSLRRGLNALLEMGLEPGVEKVVRKLLALIEDNSGIPNGVAKAIEKMLQSRAPRNPEQAALRLTEKVRASTGRRPPLGRPYGRGTRPREEVPDNSELRKAVDQIMEKIREAAKRRTSVRGGY